MPSNLSITLRQSPVYATSSTTTPTTFPVICVGNMKTASPISSNARSLGGQSPLLPADRLTSHSQYPFTHYTSLTSPSSHDTPLAASLHYYTLFSPSGMPDNPQKQASPASIALPNSLPTPLCNFKSQDTPGKNCRKNTKFLVQCSVPSQTMHYIYTQMDPRLPSLMVPQGGSWCLRRKTRNPVLRTSGEHDEQPSGAHGPAESFRNTAKPS